MEVTYIAVSNLPSTQFWIFFARWSATPSFAVTYPRPSNSRPLPRTVTQYRKGKFHGLAIHDVSRLGWFESTSLTGLLFDGHGLLLSSRLRIFFFTIVKLIYGTAFII
ncbi:unnamed protein product [Debaryomyces fabryi]|nr:unnamed protein product [Debaryomyces fabryi]